MILSLVGGRIELKMVKLTMIARVTDGLPLAEGLDDGRDMQDAEFYKQQVKALFKNLSRGQNEASRMSIETGPYVFQYPYVIGLLHLTYRIHWQSSLLCFEFLYLHVLDAIGYILLNNLGKSFAVYSSVFTPILICCGM